MGHGDHEDLGELLSNLPRGVEVVARVDGSAGMLSDSSGLAGRTDWNEDDLDGVDLLGLLDAPSVPPLVAVLGRLLDEPGGTRPVRLRIRRGDGRWSELPLLVWNEGTVAEPSLVLLSDPDAGSGPASLTDDVLTRRSFLDHLGARIVEGTDLAVVAVRLEELDAIGAALGADATEQLFTQAVTRIRGSADCDDAVAVLTPTVFAVLARGVPDRAEGHRLARLVQDLLCLPFELGETEVFTSPRIAVGLHARGVGADSLLWSSLSALDRIRPGTPVAVVEAVRAGSATQQLETRRQLRHSIERDELRLHYQPVVDLATGAVCGAEALVRWQHPERGLLAPAAFLPAAEESNFIGALGRWALREACRQCAAWLDELEDPDRFQMAVNVSANQLFEDGFADDVGDAMAVCDLEPARLLLEVTETALLDSSGHLDAVFQSLTDLGVHLAVDDFGTGHASLEHLRTVPASTVKIDRSFVAGFPHHAHDTAIVEGTISLVHSLDRVAVAEGVESVVQLERLRELGCDLAQGYVVSRPLPPRHFLGLFGVHAGR